MALEQFIGVHGLKVGIRLSKVEAVQDLGDGQVNIVTGADTYHVKADYSCVCDHVNIALENVND